MANISQDKIKVCAEILKELEPGFLPLEIFMEISRLVRLPMVVLIPLRIIREKYEIGLIQRDGRDPLWPNMWHLPGVVFRSTDTLSDAFERLLHKEIKVSKSGQPKFHNFCVNQSTRGAEVVLVYSLENCVLDADSPVKWYNIDRLPIDFIESEKNALNVLIKGIKKKEEKCL